MNRRSLLKGLFGVLVVPSVPVRRLLVKEHSSIIDFREARGGLLEPEERVCTLPRTDDPWQFAREVVRRTYGPWLVQSISWEGCLDEKNWVMFWKAKVKFSRYSAPSTYYKPIPQPLRKRVREYLLQSEPVE